MKAITTDLLNYLNALTSSAGVALTADLLTITDANNNVYRYTNADIPAGIVWGGNTYASNQILFAGGSVTTKIGIEVSNCTLKIYATSGQTLSGVSWLAALANGTLDMATVRLDRAYLSSPTTVVGVINRFQGVFGESTIGRTQAEITLSSGLFTLNAQMPRNTYQAQCVHSLYDAGCGLLQSTFQVSGAVLAGSTTTSILTNLTQADAYFNLGVITFTSGINNNVARAIKAYLHSSGQITPAYPLAQAPAAGDTFTIVPGCDKTLSTCQTRFNNLTRRKGFDFIPQPETAL